MNIYKLTKEEMKKLSKEFNQTDFGSRVKKFSMLPYAAMIACTILITIYTIKENKNIERAISFAAFIISFIGFCITQLQYGKFLKEYTESKKKEN